MGWWRRLSLRSRLTLLAVGGLADADRVTLRVRAERPLRAWLQLRAPSAVVGNGERWGASFYADASEREVTLPFDQLVPIGATSTERPVLDRIDSLLIVADTVNSQPGSSNTLHVGRVALER